MDLSAAAHRAASRLSVTPGSQIDRHCNAIGNLATHLGEQFINLDLGAGLAISYEMAKRGKHPIAGW